MDSRVSGIENLTFKLGAVFERGGKVARIECAEYFDVRDDALRAHATQVDPDGFWFLIPREIEAKTWPTEDYELVRSTVASDVPEDDLFAGIRERVAH